MLGYIFITYSTMKNNQFNPLIKHTLFGIYAFLLVLSTIILMIVNKEFLFISLVYDAVDIALAWATTYLFPKWIDINK